MIVVDAGRAAPSSRLAGTASRRGSSAGRGRREGRRDCNASGPSRPGRTNAGGAPMNILLFSMPDSFEHMPPIAVRMPNGALTSLAGNVDPEHSVTVADLILAQDCVRETVLDLVA